MMDKHTEFLTKLNRYLALRTTELSTLEQLSRMNRITYIQNKLTKNKSSVERLSISIESAEHLAKGKFTLPLKVRGVFLTEGRPQNKYYYAEELEMAAKKPENQKFPLMLDHKHKEAGKIVGVVSEVLYDDKIKGLRWDGHINDETFARNVLDGIITDVSVTVWSTSDQDNVNGLLGRDLTFTELSLVMSGAEEDNYIEAY